MNQPFTGAVAPAKGKIRGTVVWLVILVLILGSIPFLHNLIVLDLLVTLLIWAVAAGAWNLAGGYRGSFRWDKRRFLGLAPTQARSCSTNFTCGLLQELSWGLCWRL